MDSEGSEIHKLITEVFANLSVSGIDNQGEMQERGSGWGSKAPAAVGGNQSIGSFFSQNAERIVREMKQVLVAEPCPKEDRSVILLPGIMYLQTHETIGHALELDRILGYELAYAGGSFVRLDDFGKTALRLR